MKFLSCVLAISLSLTTSVSNSSIKVEEQLLRAQGSELKELRLLAFGEGGGVEPLLAFGEGGGVEPEIVLISV